MKIVVVGKAEFKIRWNGDSQEIEEKYESPFR